MLLKTLEGLFYKTKLVCGVDSICSKHQEMKAGMLMKTKQKTVFPDKAGMWFIFNRLKTQENQSWYMIENASVSQNEITHVFSI
jgi:hypothetical protein